MEGKRLSSFGAWIRIAVAGLGIGAATAQGAAAQSPGATIVGPITLFDGIPWGASRQDIIARKGNPVGEDRLEDQRTTLLYRSTVWGHPASVIYSVHARHGLIDGSITFRTASAAECEQRFGEIERLARAQHPSLEWSRTVPPRGPNQNLCDLLPDGSAITVNGYDDAGGGLSMTVDGSGVVLLYFSPLATDLDAGGE